MQAQKTKYAQIKTRRLLSSQCEFYDEATDEKLDWQACGRRSTGGYEVLRNHGHVPESAPTRKRSKELDDRPRGINWVDTETADGRCRSRLAKEFNSGIDQGCTRWKH